MTILHIHLDNIIKGPQVEGLTYVFEILMAGQNDQLCGGGNNFEMLKQAQSIHHRHFNVGNYNVREIITTKLQCV